MNYDKRISFDFATRQFTAILDGEAVGEAPTFADAELLLNEVIASLDDEPADTPEAGPDAERGRAWR